MDVVVDEKAPCVGVPTIPPGDLLGQAVSALMVDGVSQDGAPLRRSPLLAGLRSLRLYIEGQGGNRKAARRRDRDTVDIVSACAVDAIFGPEMLDRLGFFGRRRARLAQDRRSEADEGYRSNA